jgi:coenzyme PQQ precursor peptide PqqA
MKYKPSAVKAVYSLTPSKLEIDIMKWTTPDYSDVRFGFEITMYINNR